MDADDTKMRESHDRYVQTVMGLKAGLDADGLTDIRIDRVFHEFEYVAEQLAKERAEVEAWIERCREFVGGKA